MQWEDELMESREIENHNYLITNIKTILTNNQHFLH